MDNLTHLRELHEAARLKAETAELEASYKALETASRVVESEWGDIVDKREYLYDSPGFGSPLNTRATSAYDRHRGQFSPFFESEADLATIRGIARFCATSYETGINALENLVSFVLGKGFVYKAISRGESDAPEALLKEIDRAIEEFHEANKWEGDLETELVIRSDRDGECFAWMRDDGGPMLTLIEPDYITEPADCCKLNDLIECCDGDWFLGIGASPMHLDQPKGYFSQWPSGRVGFIPKARMTHVKCNVDRMIKRGLSSFYPVWQTLEKAAKLTDRTIHGSTIQASIALIKKHMAGTSRDAVESGRTSRTIATASYNTPSRYKTDYLEDYSKGGKIIGSAGFDYMYGPLGQSGAPAFMDVVGAAMRIVGSRWQMPEYMISGDASNANYASTLVSGGPFERATSRRQAFYRRHCLAIHWQALDVWCKAGRFRKLGINTLGELKSVIDIQVDCEPATVNDPQVQHTINKDLHAAKVMSSATLADRNGLDYKAEQEKIEQEPKPEMPGMLPGQGSPMDQQPFDPFAESVDPRDGDGDGLINDGKANEAPASGSGKKTKAKKGKADQDQLPAWWDEPSDNIYAKGMTNGDLIEEWLRNHKLVPDDKGYYTLFHGSPTKDLTELRDGSNLAFSVDDAIHFTGRDRDLKPSQITVYRVKVKKWQIYTGQWARTRGTVDTIQKNAGKAKATAKTPESRLAEAAKLIWGDYPGGRPVRLTEKSLSPKDGDGDGLINDGKANETAVGKKESSGPETITMPDGFELKAYRNPSRSVAKRWLANNKYGEIRGIRSPDGNVWIWNAEASDHKNVSDAMGFDWANDTIKHNGRILIKNERQLDIIYDRIEAGAWLESLSQQAVEHALREATEPKDGDGDGIIDDGKSTERPASKGEKMDNTEKEMAADDERTRNNLAAKKHLMDLLKPHGWQETNGYVAKRGSVYFTLENDKMDGAIISKVRIADHSAQSDNHASPDIEILIGGKHGKIEDVDWSGLVKSLSSKEAVNNYEWQGQW